MAAVFDTHATVKQLVAAGMNEGQAEALVAALRQVTDSQTAQLATKADIRDMATKADVEALRGATKADLALLEARLLRWMFVQMLAIVGILFGLLRFT